MTLRLRAAAVTDAGLVRSGNQDAVHAGSWLVAVADGMGGMAAGELASGLVMAAVAELDRPMSDEALVPTLGEAVEAGNDRIRAAVAEDPTRGGMGTTLTALLLSAAGTSLAIAHIGDSRAYLMRDGTLTQMTRDDTLVQLLVEEGVISAAEAASHPRRAVVTQALQGRDVALHCSTRMPQRGDRWLLCSDGLSNMVGPGVLTEVLATCDDPGGCARRLVDLALQAGGPDNITAAVTDIT